jgi:hypothetical protein
MFIGTKTFKHLYNSRKEQFEQLPSDLQSKVTELERKNRVLSGVKAHKTNQSVLKNLERQIQENKLKIRKVYETVGLKPPRMRGFERRP